ncbi:Tetratricopeptide repeat protein 28 (TPR repeat protein 28) (TPR repeat-containing big gene cloned at Keio), partial [Durusdinium trenchii]
MDAQPNVDSLKQQLSITSKNDTTYADLLNEIAGTYNHYDLDSLKAYGLLGLQASRNLDYDPGKAYAYRNLGLVYIPLSRYDSATQYFDSALTILDKKEDKMLRSEIHNGLGITNEESGNFGEALRHYFQALELKRELNDQIGIGKLHNNIGKAYYSLGVYDSATTYLIRALENEDHRNSPGRGSYSLMNLASVKTSLGEFEEGRELFEKALAIKEEINEPVPIATINAWLGEINLLTGETDQALEYYLLSLDQFKKIKHLKGIGALQAKVAEVYMKKAQYDSALLFFQAGLDDKNAIGDLQDVPALLVNMARSYQGKGDIAKAIYTNQEAIARARAINSKSELTEAYELMHRLYAASNQVSKAYESLKLHLTYKDSLLNEQKLKEIKTLETVYGVKQLQQDKEQLEQEKETQDLIYAAEIRRQNVIKYSTMGGLFLVMLLAVTYYRSYLRKKKAHNLLKSKNELITSQKEFLEEQSQELKKINSQLEELSTFKEGLTQMIAHDMKNPLHVIISLAEGKADKSTMKVINQSGREMLNLVTNMLDIQKFDEARIELQKATLPILKLVEEALLQTELLFVSKGLTSKIEIPKGLAVLGDKSLLERVIVNLLTNAVKYSPVGGTIEITGELLNDSE